MGTMKEQPAVPTPSQHPYHVGRSTKNGGVVIPTKADSSGH
jgi:hypothetical protein